MDEGGIVIHIAKSGRLIIKANDGLDVGTFLLDSEGRKVARVTEIFGPVRSPYASALPLSNRVKRLAGKMVYIVARRPKR